MSIWRDKDVALTRQAANLADNISKAIVASININEIMLAWKDSHPKENITPKEARAWIQVHGHPNNKPIIDALKNVYAVGAKLGRDLGVASYAKETLTKAAPTKEQLMSAINTDWSNWQPGNNPAELLVRPKGALAKLMGSQIVTATGISMTTLNRIGTKLADGLKLGLTDKAIAATLEMVIRDSERALMIATTEMARAMCAEQLNVYTEYGVEQVEWLAFDPCDDCQANADQGPIPVGTSFDSGDDAPPAHPNCRCDVVPIIDGADLQLPDTEGEPVELATRADLKKTVLPGPLEIERGISRLDTLPNPNHPELDKPEKYVESPWQTVPVPTINPNKWDDAVLVIVQLDELFGTDLWLKRKNVRKHIENMGQALLANRSYGLVVDKAGTTIIIDGHHRLFAQWLLGQETAPVWKVKI